MSKILVLGGSGMLGHKMFQILGERYPETRCTLSAARIDAVLERTGLYDDRRAILGFDAMDQTHLRTVLRREKPDIVVNCIGVIKQRSAALDALPSIAINSLLPHLLSSICADWGGRVIHFSTDCVFSGRGGPYVEESFADAEDLYGRTKYLGEVQGPNALTLRTSIIGHELKNFASLLDWFLAQEGRSISGYRRVLYSGVTTSFLADVVSELIGKHRDLSGLFQVASQPISKYELLCLVRDAYGFDVKIEPEDDPVSDRSMTGDKFVQATGISTSSWPSLVAALAEEFPTYKAWRQG